MSENTNIELARRLIVAFDAGDDSVVDELIHPEHREHAATDGRRGQEGVRGSIAWVSQTFADRRTVTEDLIASGDRVVARVRFSATHVGEVEGIAATGRRFEVGPRPHLAGGRGPARRALDGRDDLSMARQVGALEPLA